MAQMLRDLDAYKRAAEWKSTVQADEHRTKRSPRSWWAEAVAVIALNTQDTATESNFQMQVRRDVCSSGFKDVFRFGW